MGWLGGRVAIALVIAAPVLAGSAPLFPVPLHLVRRIEDPLAAGPVEIEEYCAGNKIITVNGSRTAIVDYERQELLEIDRSASTYSVVSFHDIAAARAVFAPPVPKRNAIATTTANHDEWKTTALGMRASRGGRSADSFEIAGDRIKLELAVDRQVTLSRSALDALSGSAYPNDAASHHEALVHACARTSNALPARAADADGYGLPLDQTITIEADEHTHVTLRNVVLRVTNDLPPPDVMAIPAGAKLVESRATQMLRNLKELGDQVPASRP
ncbi:MAG TPA: hypothetical protein VF980_05395 [Thermoanaerobaculia bacterium]